MTVPTPVPTDATFAVNLDPVVLWVFIGITGLLILKVLFAVAASIKDGSFDVRLLPEFMRTHVLSYVIPFAGMAIASVFMPAIKVIYLTAATAYAGKLVADIKDSVTAMLGPSFQLQAQSADPSNSRPRRKRR